MKRFEHAIPAGIICAIGMWVAYVSYTQTPAEAFVFPRLVATVFVVLAAWTFVRSLMPDAKVQQAISAATWSNILPGVAVAAIYVFWAGKALGFYTATTLAVFVLISYYDPAPHRDVRSWGKRILITAGFMAVMYLLFAMLLGVFTPREVLFR